ncbi:Ldh family oxidoreductase [Candidatus Odyssella thessalonicensis]|uniref:Ldh family oxidoreductase n=1 Tax=Candidatus Odyssella thessalonicensis TaxID=84647 RepID=UPI000225BB46|nr:Ldh family oxidoreductase [Candidatus Odyssella thessalonicensis]
MENVLEKPPLTTRIHIKVLEEFLIDTLLSLGLKEETAAITAEVLIAGDKKGYHSHGVARIFQIEEGINNSTINPNANIDITMDWPAIAVFDANYGIGQWSGKKAMEYAIRKAKQQGVGAVGVINASHLGILGYYSELASKEGCIGIVMSTSSPAVVIKGGKVKTFGTNPISYSIPNTAFPITADFSTSKVSRGKIYEYLHSAKKLPEGWAVTQEGLLTTSPEEALKGGLLTIDGDIKGCLLSLLISILCGSLIGGVINPKVTGTRYMNEKPNKGDFFIVLDVNKFTNYDLFLHQMIELDNFITAQNVDFRLPGKRSSLYSLIQEEYINIPDSVYEFIKSN